MSAVVRKVPRSYTTPLGDRVTHSATYDETQNITYEHITIEHPLELVEVALGKERVLPDRHARRI